MWSMGARRRLIQALLNRRLVEINAGPYERASGWLPGDVIGYHCRTKPHGETE
jgi:hypothetical protein